MPLSRRKTIVGIGAIVAGSGAVFATGAFTQVEAERQVTVETAGDADALLAFTPARDDEAYVAYNEDDMIEINLDGNDQGAEGLNQNARSRFENLVEITNQGTQDVDSLTFEFAVANTDDDEGHEDALRITAGEETIDATGAENILDGEDDLSPGESTSFGVEVDLLLEGGIDDIDDDADVTLTITAEAADE